MLHQLLQQMFKMASLCMVTNQAISVKYNVCTQLSYDVCLEVRGEIIRTVVLYCVLKLCTVISTLR